MNAKIEKWLGVGLISGALVVAAAGVAGAQTPPAGTAPGTGPLAGTPQARCVTGAGQMGGMMRGAPAWGGPAVSQDTVEKLLGISEADLIARRQAGESLAQIAASKGVTEKALVDAILAAKKTALDEAVKAGTITQVQADTMYQNMQTQVTASVTRTETGPQAGRGGMGGGMSGQGGMRQGGAGAGFAQRGVRA